MFLHNFKYTFKTLIKNKSLIFWTFAFPIILGTLFYLAFSDIEKNEELDVFSIAIVDTEKKEDSSTLKTAFDELSHGDDKLFDIKYVSLEQAKKLLEEKEIVGYVELDTSPKVVVAKNGIEETVLKTVTETITEEIQIANTIFENKITDAIMNSTAELEMSYLYEKVKGEVEEVLKNREVNIKDTSPSKLSYTMIEFYTLIAMACLYGGILSMVSINKNLANMCSTGKRVTITPTKRMTLILSSVLASFIVQLMGLALLFLYTIFLLHIDYGDKTLFIFLLSFVGSLAGVSLGTAVATLVKSTENMKTGILLAITMTGSYFSGMMGITMKYIVDTNLPILNRINPANMITDGFYALYYYEGISKFIFNVMSLLIFSFVLIVLSMNGLRRQRYDSI